MEYAKGTPPSANAPDLSPTRFPLATSLIQQSPEVGSAIESLATAIPWKREPEGRSPAYDDAAYRRAILDLTEQILSSHRHGRPDYVVSTAVSAGTSMEMLPSAYVVDELIRGSRAEAARLRELLQTATEVSPSSATVASLFRKTGWFDDGSRQQWAFVFRSATVPEASLEELNIPKLAGTV